MAAFPVFVDMARCSRLPRGSGNLADFQGCQDGRALGVQGMVANLGCRGGVY